MRPEQGWFYSPSHGFHLIFLTAVISSRGRGHLDPAEVFPQQLQGELDRA